MPARWLFGLLFVGYLFGPARAPEDPPRSPVLMAATAAPVETVLRAVYSHVPSEDRTRWAGRLVGITLTAGAVTLTFLTLLRLTSLEGAWLLAVTAAFASPLWSWTSRSNVPEAAAVLAVAALLWLAIGRRENRVLVLLALGALATALVLAWRELPSTFDPAVPVAYLVSPGRGLVFFAPLVVLALAALLRRDGPRHVVWSGALLMLAALAELAARPEPWGPLGFGPTLLSPYVPVFATMSAGLPKRWLRAGVLLSIPAAIAHGAAVFMGGHTWDERRMVVHHPEALWDLADSPFTDLAFGPPLPDPADFGAERYLMSPGEHLTRAGGALPWLAYGWEQPEPPGVWASGRESWLVIAAPPGDYVLTLIAAGPRRRGQGQRLLVERPGGPPLELTFSKQLWEFEPLSIPFRADRNVSVLKLRPAHTWMPGHGDVRRCSLFLSSLRLERTTVGIVSVVLATERGPIELELDVEHAPRTAANFLRYVDTGHYDGGVIHRTVRLDNQPDKKVRIEVIQGGVNPARKKDGFAPIAIERTRDTGLTHEDGTLSMARDGPDTATSDFFICIGDQPSLDFGGRRNPDGQGFAAFGRVVAGMDVVRAIQKSPAEGQRLTPPVRILSARRR